MNISESLAHLRELRTTLPAALAAETDPLTRAHGVGEIIAELGKLEDELKEVRRPAVAELRAQGYTVRALAAELDLSPARIDQISKGRRA
ncbi:hypothetical protein [Nocardiopsis metallicus]|uniref:DNA-binding NarL/FixJ family response regulator n=1 Tax=Nocardiopsis metallicus TaxID=179819 RepID=A0A840WUT9_9ACTN|nr:hypothetical protein [Nocardiopsis metallicus]MBB5495795.1 DNA-binding NarL/FixJ family response regulator [Nocardiopsis metallicus]